MQTAYSFLESDFTLLRRSVTNFFARRQTRNLLMQLTKEQKKDLGIPTGFPATPSVSLNPPW